MTSEEACENMDVDFQQLDLEPIKEKSFEQ